MDLVLYIHGKGGSAAESTHYGPLFPDCEVRGLDYAASAPWEAAAEFRGAVEALKEKYDGIILIANSIGAYLSMHAGMDALIRKAYLISPIVDMETLITGMMRLSGITEEELRMRGVIPAAFGEDLSWEYLSYVRAHPVRWNAPTEILYGGKDELTSRGMIEAFAAEHGAHLTVMEEGEHWFHTPEQMRFLDAWILSGRE